jgi:acetylornithine deacetylase/succinyl-diaminopimelate desuccinylase-like protein
MGFGLDDDQVHAPNEKFSLSSYFGGMRSVAYLYEELSAEPARTRRSVVTRPEKTS